MRKLLPVSRKPWFVLLIVAIVWMLILSIIFVIYTNQIKLRAWVNAPVITDWVEDPDSRLLPLLLTKESFSSDFSWGGILISQHPDSSDDGDNTLYEEAHVYYTGYAGDHEARVYETVTKHLNPVTNLGEVELPINSFDPNKLFYGPNAEHIMFSINPVKVGSLQESICAVFLERSTNCTVMMAYSDLTIELGLAIDYVAPKTDIENILNPLLEDIARRLSEY